MTLASFGKKELLAGTVLTALVFLAIYLILYRSFPRTSIALSVLTLGCYGMLLFFFRDPHRVPPVDEHLLLAPADGTVVDIETVHEDQFLKQQALRIGIFLSVFDVHLNRSPAAGKVAFLRYRPGKFLAAYHPKAGTENEMNLVGLEHGQERYLVKQISGVLARRIVCPLKLGDTLQAGQVFGMIKLGSRTELYVPKTLPLRLQVKIGDRVAAGLTVLGEKP